ncbi:MAG TPA: GEVED domain-containing protein [Parafilimonas sp.]|nr:GEVED domain-containing protein [Parafilimonas sp.]
MKTQILLVSMFVCVTQTFAGNHQFTTHRGGCISPTGLKASGITRNSATVSWNAVPGATSYNLEHESVGVWTGVFVTDTSYTLKGLASNTTYSFHVLAVCSGSYSVYSTPSSFTTKGKVIDCISRGNSTAHEFINRVKFGSINNLSGDNGGYKNYTSLSTHLISGQVYNIRLTPGFHFLANTEYWSVYIDYNHNNSFADAGELVFTGNASTVVKGPVTIPSSSATGVTRMRVQMHYGSQLNSSCAKFDYGEVEDYSVNISVGSGIAATSSSTGDISARSKTSLVVAPNPVSGSNASVYYTLANNGVATFKVINMDGHILQTIQLGNKNTGAFRYNLAGLDKLPSGNYIIVLEQNSQTVTRYRFTIIR